MRTPGAHTHVPRKYLRTVRGQVKKIKKKIQLPRNYHETLRGLYQYPCGSRRTAHSAPYSVHIYLYVWVCVCVVSVCLSVCVCTQRERDTHTAHSGPHSAPTYRYLIHYMRRYSDSSGGVSRKYTYYIKKVYAIIPSEKALRRAR
jgi:hypothetical protein